jgi:hypothetical protein
MLAILNSAAPIRRPMVTQCGTAAVLFGTGDMIAQQAIEKKRLKGHDVRSFSPVLFLFGDSLDVGLIIMLGFKWARTGRLTLYGGERIDYLSLNRL